MANKSDAVKPRLVDVQGRVVVPKDVLDHLGIRKGEDYIAFAIEDEGVVVKRVNWSIE